MQVKVKFLDRLRLEAQFEDYKIISDQPIRYKGDATAPGPFDYFLASSALCAAYFVKAYCQARDIPTEDIKITQDNIIDPANRYKQSLQITAELPESLSEKDRQGIINSMERCSVKRVIQNAPDFKIRTVNTLSSSSGLIYNIDRNNQTTKTEPPVGKDLSYEDTLMQMSGHLESLGIKIEIDSWRNTVPHVWSVNIKDADSPMCFSNGKGKSKEAALCSALGEYLERLSNNYFYNDYYLGEEISKGPFIHYPEEKWFKSDMDDRLPEGLMDELLLSTYNIDDQLRASHLVDTNSGNKARGVCALPFYRQSDQQKVYIPVNLIGNLFVSNGMSAGNTKFEARVQCLSEIFERAIKNKIITEELTLPDVPDKVLQEYPDILQAIAKLEKEGFPILVKDASLGGEFPVVCVTLLNPKTGGVFASFGSHPQFYIALERALTELLQGRSFEGLNDLPAPTFSTQAVQEPNNIVEHFVDSSGVVSWKFFSDQPHYKFEHWNFSGSTKDEYEHLMAILTKMDKEVYVADYNELGTYACRILVPQFSEIYPIEDLVWDNNNMGVRVRSMILNIHSLSQDKLSYLLSELEELELDDYKPIVDFIGVAFDETTPWGKCTVGELKAFICFAIGDLEQAKDYVDAFNYYNDNTPERRRFFQLLGVILNIKLKSDFDLTSYIVNLKRMYGKSLYEKALGVVDGTITFYGLTPTDNSLTGITKHEKLIASYKKLIRARSHYYKNKQAIE